MPWVGQRKKWNGGGGMDTIMLRKVAKTKGNCNPKLNYPFGKN